MKRITVLLLFSLGFMLGLCVFGHAQTAGPIQFINNQPTVPYVPVSYFAWLPPNATLPSDMQCAQEIAQTAEGIPSNAAMNAHAPSSADLAPFYANPNGFAGQVLPMADYMRVNGSYPTLLKVAPSTDMIVRWAACKWGVDEDTLRAQAWYESNWQEQQVGDMCTSAATCTQTGFTALYFSPSVNPPVPITFRNGTQVLNVGGGWQSWGIGQEKVWYFITLWPMVKDSTAFAADFRGAAIRGCLNGDQASYFATQPSAGGAQNGHAAYVGDAGSDLYDGCVASHFSGDWWDAGAVTYWNAVSALVTSKPWPGGL